jgi:hypothetical protein
MDEHVKLGFELDTKEIDISTILPTRVIDEHIKSSPKYAAIAASINEVGIIEPPVVYPMTGASHQFLLLDGHLRIEALKASGQTSVLCLISTDDEGYTYNHKVNRLMPIQEHFMIIRALERGVSEERIAAALRVDVSSIRAKRNLLRGICDEAVALLKGVPIGAVALQHLRKVKPSRQVELAEMMNIVANYSSPYCQALVAATPKEQLVDTGPSKTCLTLGADDVARMQREMETLQRDLQAHEDTYGANFLNLVIVRGYLSKLLDNGRVVRFLSSSHPDLLNAFQQIVDSTSLEG